MQTINHIKNSILLIFAFLCLNSSAVGQNTLGDFNNHLISNHDLVLYDHPEFIEGTIFEKEPIKSYQNCKLIKYSGVDITGYRLLSTCKVQQEQSVFFDFKTRYQNYELGNMFLFTNAKKKTNALIPVRCIAGLAIYDNIGQNIFFIQVSKEGATFPVKRVETSGDTLRKVPILNTKSIIENDIDFIYLFDKELNLKTVFKFNESNMEVINKTGKKLVRKFSKSDITTLLLNDLTRLSQECEQQGILADWIEVEKEIF